MKVKKPYQYRFENKEEFELVMSRVYDGSDISQKPYLGDNVVVPIKIEHEVYDPCYHIDILWENEEPEIFASKDDDGNYLYRMSPENPKHKKAKYIF